MRLPVTAPPVRTATLERPPVPAGHKRVENID